MRKLFILLISVGLASCVQEIDTPFNDGNVFVGTMEEIAATKTSLNQNNQVLWSADDELVIFEKSSSGSKYKVQSQSSGVQANFEKVSAGVGAGTVLDDNVAFYPYSSGVECVSTSSTSYKISGFTVPHTQSYVENSFDPKASPMVAVSNSQTLHFNNVLGGLKLRITGECTVKKIIVAGNNQERLSGKADITAYKNFSKPVVEMLESSGTEVVLDCGENGVALNNDVPVEFILSLPPVEFSEGFVVTVVDSEGVEKEFEAARNTVYRSSLLTMPKISMNDEEFRSFDVEFYEAGPGYVTVNAIVPGETRVAYMITEEPVPDISQVMLNVITDTFATFYEDGPQQLTGYPIAANSKYYLYLAAKFEDHFSDLYCFEFETEQFESSDLVTVTGLANDGYTVQIQVPQSVKNSIPNQPGSAAIRYNQCNLLMYNYARKTGNDDVFNLFYNGGKLCTEDTLLEYSDATNYGQADWDANEDGVVDEKDTYMLWDPIVPGEPVVFLAGEFEWVSKPEEYRDGGAKEDYDYKVNGFSIPWDEGYQLPCVDSDKYWSLYNGGTKSLGAISGVDVSSPTDAVWTGAFQKKIFQTPAPEFLEGGFGIEARNFQTDDPRLIIKPTRGIYRYIYMVLDDATYQEMMELLEGHEEYRQWAVTSYFAYASYGARTVEAVPGSDQAGNAEIDFRDIFKDNSTEENCHLLITGMSGGLGSPQCFLYHTFTKPAFDKNTVRINIENAYVQPRTTGYDTVFDGNLAGQSVTVNGKGYRMQYDGQLYVMVEEDDTYFVGYPWYSFSSAIDGYDVSYPSVWYRVPQCPYVGVYEGGDASCQMRPMSAVINVDIQSTTECEYLEFTIPGGFVCGAANYGWSSFEDYSVFGGGDTVRVPVVDQSVCFPIPPGVASGGIAVKLYGKNGALITERTSSAEFTFERAKVYKLPM